MRSHGRKFAAVLAAHNVALAPGLVWREAALAWTLRPPRRPGWPRRRGREHVGLAPSHEGEQHLPELEERGPQLPVPRRHARARHLRLDRLHEARALGCAPEPEQRRCEQCEDARHECQHHGARHGLARRALARPREEVAALGALLGVHRPRPEHVVGPLPHRAAAEPAAEAHVVARGHGGRVPVGGCDVALTVNELGEVVIAIGRQGEALGGLRRVLKAGGRQVGAHARPAHGASEAARAGVPRLARALALAAGLGAGPRLARAEAALRVARAVGTSGGHELEGLIRPSRGVPIPVLLDPRGGLQALGVAADGRGRRARGLVDADVVDLVGDGHLGAELGEPLPRVELVAELVALQARGAPGQAAVRAAVALVWARGPAPARREVHVENHVECLIGELARQQRARVLRVVALEGHGPPRRKHGRGNVVLEDVVEGVADETVVSGLPLALVAVLLREVRRVEHGVGGERVRVQALARGLVVVAVEPVVERHVVLGAVHRAVGVRARVELLVVLQAHRAVGRSKILGETAELGALECIAVLPGRRLHRGAHEGLAGADALEHLRVHARALARIDARLVVEDKVTRHRLNDVDLRGASCGPVAAPVKLLRAKLVGLFHAVCRALVKGEGPNVVRRPLKGRSPQVSEEPERRPQATDVGPSGHLCRNLHIAFREAELVPRLNHGRLVRPRV
mmetsp:Transcript_26338/g.77304  ORF Transcript_26338/g.77304 Transcript_26338/m.77304 type:complete len:688 (-) Transcript_26338:365-2428(-)